MRNHDTLSISPEWSVVGYWFRNVLDTAQGLGCDRDSLLLQAGLSPGILEDLETHYPLADLYQLIRLIRGHCGIEDLGLHYVLNAHPCGMGLVGMAAYTAPTVRAAWELVFRYRHLVMNTGNSQLLNEGDTCSIRWYPYSRDIVSDRCFVDAVTAGWISNSQALSGRTIIPTSVELTYTRPRITSLFSETYGNNVSFDQPYNSITFRRTDIDAPVRYANERVHRVLCREAEEAIAHLRAACAFSEKLEYHIRQQLPQGETTVETLSALMHVAPRTLQRRLKRENTSFHELLVNVRHELALQHLQEEKLSTLDVALRLGYNQASSFCTAFKSWTGLTPSEYRGEQEAN
ncbi:AraC family transcriptional regulator [Pseudomaricurvus alkylphenolicus]|uniref:AraC family transcriptional regulator n=1 Tax=Pseudomaricurvus alkylphenolicus TaxID=1306991 RepID=UPI001423E5B0|nr:AraC family transcriptional regulator [Pseudomaricurvus alkylphenolicus]NIB41641.1 AraC family transcriptional regulator [Pseudomaricurvus alkylphenolicus]